MSTSAPSLVPARLVWPLVGALSAGMLLVRLAFELSEQLASGETLSPGRALFEEVVGAVVAVPYMYLAVQAMRRWPFPPGDRWRWGLRLAVLFAALSLLHAPLLFAVRGGTAALVGFEGYALVPSWAQVLREAINDVLPALTTVAGMTAAESVLQARQRERRAFELERSLLEAELRNVRLQLQPHFLFNALNTIASTMYDDPAAADRQLTQLSELLRASLRTTEAQEVPLRDELSLVEQYVGLMQARFPGALTWEASLGAGTHDLLVPSMSLQPLVENAVRHGALAVRGTGRVQLTAVVVAPPGAAEDGDAVLELRVYDDGPGAPPDRDPRTSGTGLSATARRIALLYGARGSLTATNLVSGGFEVVLRVPAVLSRRRVEGDDAGAAGRRGGRPERAGSPHPVVS